MFGLEGYFDEYVYEDLQDDDKATIVARRRQGIPKSGSKYIYHFIMIPSAGFLTENKPLPPNVELKLSFDRLTAEYSTLLVDQTSKTDPLKGTILELKNVFAQVEYVSSPQMRAYFDRISENPIPYVYDECAVLFKALPQNEQSIRLDNLKGGNTPDYLFMAICRTCLLYTSPSPRDRTRSRMPSSA